MRSLPEQLTGLDAAQGALALKSTVRARMRREIIRRRHEKEQSQKIFANRQGWRWKTFATYLASRPRHTLMESNHSCCVGLLRSPRLAGPLQLGAAQEGCPAKSNSVIFRIQKRYICTIVQ